MFGDASDISDDEGDAAAAAPAKPAVSDDEDDVRRGSDYEDDQDEPRAVIQVTSGERGTNERQVWRWRMEEVWRHGEV